MVCRGWIKVVRALRDLHQANWPIQHELGEPERRLLTGQPGWPAVTGLIASAPSWNDNQGTAASGDLDVSCGLAI
jgi:hypothetical protein